MPVKSEFQNLVPLLLYIALNKWEKMSKFCSFLLSKKCSKLLLLRLVKGRMQKIGKVIHNIITYRFADFQQKTD